MAERPLERRLRDQLRFELDLHLYGNTHGYVFVLDDSARERTGQLKRFLRAQAGVRHFYRVRYAQVVDVCFGSFAHAPDVERVDAEYAWLCSLTTRHLGSGVSSAAL